MCESNGENPRWLDERRIPRDFQFLHKNFDFVVVWLILMLSLFRRTNWFLFQVPLKDLVAHRAEGVKQRKMHVSSIFLSTSHIIPVVKAKSKRYVTKYIHFNNKN
jgi:hypothetical protein